MAFTSRSPVRISPWIGLPLSVFMIVVATITFVGAPYGDGSEWPVLTTFRDKRSELNILNYRAQQAPPWLYKGGKGATSILWSILIPLQHSQSIRQRLPTFHRGAGYMVVLLSIELGLAGYYLSSRGMVTTHEKWYHVHSFYGARLPIPLLVWPTFDFSIGVLGVFYFVSLFKLFTAIRAQKVELHRRWAVFHSMTGYAISIERLIAVLVIALGWVLHSMPGHFKTWLQLPLDRDGKMEVELSALAWTLAAAGITVAAWAYKEFAKVRLTESKSGKARIEAVRNNK
ncbi:hypothetical protein E5D57_013567 [Metarhizium anisopliae]|nr:hypothetical protein E5D57_013567 [Metarhizium anisopliae]